MALGPSLAEREHALVVVPHLPRAEGLHTGPCHGEVPGRAPEERDAPGVLTSATPREFLAARASFVDALEEPETARFAGRTIDLPVLDAARSFELGLLARPRRAYLFGDGKGAVGAHHGAVGDPSATLRAIDQHREPRAANSTMSH